MPIIEIHVLLTIKFYMLYKFVKLKYMRKKTSEFVENVIKKKIVVPKRLFLPH